MSSSEGNKRVITLLRKTLGDDGLLNVIAMEKRFKGTIERGLEIAAFWEAKKPRIAMFVEAMKEKAMEAVHAGLIRILEDDELTTLQETIACMDLNPRNLKVLDYCEDSPWSERTQKSFVRFLRSGTDAHLADFHARVANDVERTRFERGIFIAEAFRFYEGDSGADRLDDDLDEMIKIKRIDMEVEKADSRQDLFEMTFYEGDGPCLS